MPGAWSTEGYDCKRFNLGALINRRGRCAQYSTVIQGLTSKVMLRVFPWCADGFQFHILWYKFQAIWIYHGSDQCRQEKQKPLDPVKLCRISAEPSESQRLLPAAPKSVGTPADDWVGRAKPPFNNATPSREASRSRNPQSKPPRTFPAMAAELSAP